MANAQVGVHPAALVISGHSAGQSLGMAGYWVIWSSMTISIWGDAQPGAQRGLLDPGFLDGARILDPGWVHRPSADRLGEQLGAVAVGRGWPGRAHRSSA